MKKRATPSWVGDPLRWKRGNSREVSAVSHARSLASLVYIYIYNSPLFRERPPLQGKESARKVSTISHALSFCLSLSSVCLSLLRVRVRVRARSLSLPNTRSFSFTLFPLLLFPLSHLPPRLLTLKEGYLHIYMYTCIYVYVTQSSRAFFVLGAVRNRGKRTCFLGRASHVKHTQVHKTGSVMSHIIYIYIYIYIYTYIYTYIYIYIYIYI